MVKVGGFEDGQLSGWMEGMLRLLRATMKSRKVSEMLRQPYTEHKVPASFPQERHHQSERNLLLPRYLCRRPYRCINKQCYLRLAISRFDRRMLILKIPRWSHQTKNPPMRTKHKNSNRTLLFRYKRPTRPLLPSRLREPPGHPRDITQATVMARGLLTS